VQGQQLQLWVLKTQFSTKNQQNPWDKSHVELAIQDRFEIRSSQTPFPPRRLKEELMESVALFAF